MQHAYAQQTGHLWIAVCAISQPPKRGSCSTTSSLYDAFHKFILFCADGQGHVQSCSAIDILSAAKKVSHLENVMSHDWHLKRWLTSIQNTHTHKAVENRHDAIILLSAANASKTSMLVKNVGNKNIITHFETYVCVLLIKFRWRALMGGPVWGLAIEPCTGSL